MSVEAGFEVASAYVTLLIDDADFEAAVTEKIEAACATGAATGGDVLVQGLTGAAAKGGDEIESALLEAIAGSGDAMAAQIGDGLTSGLVQAAVRAGDEAGLQAGDQFTSEFEASTSSVAADLGDRLVAGVAQAGDDAGHEISRGLESSLAGTGLRAAGEIASGILLGSVPIGPAVGHEIGAGMAATLPAAARAAASAAAGSLTEGLVEGASGTGDQLASQISGELRAAIGSETQATAAQLTDALLEGAAGAGDALAEQIGVEMQPGIASAGEQAGESLKEAILEGASGLGDALGADLGSGISQGASIGADGGAAEIERAMQSVASDLEQEGEDAGVRYVQGLQRGLSSVNVPAGGMSLDELLSGGKGPDEFVQDPNDPYRTVRQSALEAEQAARESTEGLLASEAQALRGTQDYDVQLLATFEEIYRGGAGLSDQLATAMTLAFQGIEADTSAFTATELRLFTEFFQTLESEGDQAALDLATRMSIVTNPELFNTDLIGQGLSSVGKPMAGAGAAGATGTASLSGLGDMHAAQLAAENAAAAATELGTAEQGAEAAAGGLGAAMGGPLMWGLLGVASMLPMVTSLFNNSSQATQAYAQQQQQLQQAISQDSDMIGANTVATIANQISTSGAADTLKGYGISLTDATSAIAGVHSAQKDVNSVLNEQIDNLQSLIQEQSAHSQGVNTDIEAERQQIEQLQVTKEAMAQLEQDTIDAVQHDNDLAQATLNAEQAIGVFNVQVRAGVLALEQQAQTQKINADALASYDMTLTSSSQAYTDAVHNQDIALADNAIKARINADALNASLPPQAQLSTEAITAALAYQQASTATSLYTSSLTALYGQYGQTSNAEAAATIAIDNLTGKITTGKNAVDLMTDAGSKNFQIFNQAASAAETYAEKVYQQTGDTEQANQVLQTFAGKLDTAASKAGLTKDQIHQLNEELFGVQNASDITIKVDDSQARQEMNAFSDFVQGEIDSMNNSVVVPTINRGLHGISARASGGPVQAGQVYITGEKQPELFVPESDGYIYPSLEEGRKALAGTGMSVHFNYYGTQQPTHEQRADMLRELAVAAGVGA
jgi:hypothetical protein